MTSLGVSQANISMTDISKTWQPTPKTSRAIHITTGKRKKVAFFNLGVNFSFNGQQMPLSLNADVWTKAILTYDTEGDCMLGRALSVSDDKTVRACVGRTGLRDLHTAVCLTTADGQPQPTCHHLKRRHTPRLLYWHRRSE